MILSPNGLLFFALTHAGVKFSGKLANVLLKTLGGTPQSLLLFLMVWLKFFLCFAVGLNARRLGNIGK